MNWAWAQKMSPTPKLILMALADASNHINECWPGVPFVAEKCCVSERTVQRVLREFEAINLMTVSERFTPSGRRTSNAYRLHIDSQGCPASLSPSPVDNCKRGDILSGSGATLDVTVDGDRVVSPPEPQKESKQQPLQFPRQLSNAERQSIGEQLIAITLKDGQAMLDELADAMETGTIKTSPVRWFRGLMVRQKAGAFIPTGGIRFGERRKQELQRRTIADANAKVENLPSSNRTLARESLNQAKLLIRSTVADGIAED